MQVRRASPSDIAAVVSVTNAAFAVETFIEGTRTSEDEIRDLIANHHLLVADDERGLAASVSVEIHGPRGYFGMLAVDPSRRGAGLGRLMIEAAEVFARERGCTHMDITVLSLRTELPPLYRRFGYQEVGTGPFHPDRGRRLFAPCHCLFMEKRL